MWGNVDLRSKPFWGIELPCIHDFREDCSVSPSTYTSASKVAKDER
jgi:hypothetical protein